MFRFKALKLSGDGSRATTFAFGKSKSIWIEAKPQFAPASKIIFGWNFKSYKKEYSLSLKICLNTLTSLVPVCIDSLIEQQSAFPEIFRQGKPRTPNVKLATPKPSRLLNSSASVHSKGAHISVRPCEQNSGIGSEVCMSESMCKRSV